MIKSMRDVRREYGKLTLERGQENQDPFVLFEAWFNELLSTDNYDPTAMLLSTIDENNQPDSRVVLLKGLEQQKFIFYTNYTSSKAKHMERNPCVSLNFFWPFMARQVRIQGIAAKLNSAESDAYFLSRPRMSQIAAIASEQSSVLNSREQLEHRMNQLIEKYGQEPIIRPDTWGGYTVSPKKIEFWQGRDSRLHDRLQYTKDDEESWLIERLAP